MKVIFRNDYGEMSQEAARTVARQILAKQDSVLGLPTGNTPIGMYGQLIKLCSHGLISFSKVVTFNLDEYCGLSSDHPGSFYQYMRENLFDHVDISWENIHIPDGVAPNIEGECRRYEEEIRRHGGIDLQVLGIGLNGHIGFNEPGSGWGTTTRQVQLSHETRRRESRNFGDPGEVPTQAITIGIKTIMRAKKILLLASGKEKAQAAEQALRGPVTEKAPASILQLHPAVTVILDKEASSLIKPEDVLELSTIGRPD